VTRTSCANTIDVAEHVAGDIERAAESVNIAFDGAVHAETSPLRKISLLITSDEVTSAF